jgi:quercetin dioxygenase-like cupin family protein
MTLTPYVRLYTDETGESHFEDLAAALTEVDFAPPAPPLELSEYARVERFAFFCMPAGWHGDWHPTPRRQYFIVLSGEVEAITSDGETRRFTPGNVVLVEDTTGKGHASRSVNGDAFAAVIQFAD